MGCGRLYSNSNLKIADCRIAIENVTAYFGVGTGEIGLREFCTGPEIRLTNLGPCFMPHPAQVLQDRLIDFAVRACRVAAGLPRTPLGFHLSRQLVRSATSPAPNYGEAQSAESRQDFVHKMRICLKELREAQVWLRMIQRLGLACTQDLEAVLDECGQLVAIFTRSVVTASKRRSSSGN